MIISRGRRYIFVHIPKTGGTALSLALEGRAMADDILIGDTPKARRRRGRIKDVQSAGRLWKHSRLSDIDGLVRAQELPDLFIFTLVRNPWDRLVSYYHWLREQRFDHPAVALSKALEFSDFLTHPQTAASVGAQDYVSYVTGQDGVERCDLFARLEHLQADLAPLWTHLGFDLMPLPHTNRSERRADYRSYYSDAEAEIVARLCARDIARFGYCF